jgi:glycosyltransferase involved in cell wall biosynthesis
MRILVETHTMEIGGSQFNAVELAEGAARLGHEVTVFGPDGPLVEEVHRRGLEWIQAPERRGTPCPATAMALTRLTRRRKFDVVHPYEWNTLLDTMYGPGWLLGTPVLSTVLSVDVPFFLPTSVPMIVCMRELWEQERRRRPDVRFMEIPIDTELNAPGTAPALTLSDGRVTDVRSHVGAADDERLVVVVGRLASRLKLAGLLDAVAAMPLVNDHVKARLVIVGDGPERPRVEEAVRRATESLGRATTVMVGQFLDPRPFYQAADLALGMGSSILRAMAFEKAVIVQGEAGFWEPLTPETLPMFLSQGWYGIGPGKVDLPRLAELIVSALLDPDPELPLLGRRTVEEYNSLGAISEWLSSVYSEVAVQQHAWPERLSSASGNAWELTKFRASRALSRLRGSS